MRKLKALLVLLLALPLLLPTDAPANLKVNKTITGTLKVTLEHPFLINGEWIPAKELKVGDILKTIDGKKAVITKVEYTETKEPFLVYNIEAGIYHNFVVDNGIIVHNSNPDVLVEKVDLANLLPENILRVSDAETLLGRTLSSAERKALLAAHEYGLDDSIVKSEYFVNVAKARTLRKAGFSEFETRLVMERGIAGKLEYYNERTK